MTPRLRFSLCLVAATLVAAGLCDTYWNGTSTKVSTRRNAYDDESSIDPDHS
ncbi:hypothetical protein C8F01DRAFT_1260393 [Mycena amicta]|nr:hypothetical protein C8F01DRAFT_1260393 [Mycena amicta]